MATSRSHDHYIAQTWRQLELMIKIIARDYKGAVVLESHQVVIASGNCNNFLPLGQVVRERRPIGAPSKNGPILPQGGSEAEADGRSEAEGQGGPFREEHAPQKTPQVPASNA